MSKESIVLISFLAVLVLVGSVSADEDIYWDDGDPCDHLWSSPLNWDVDRCPTSIDPGGLLGDCAYIEPGFDPCQYPVVDDSVIAEDPNTGSYALTVVVGTWQAGPAYMTMTGGYIHTDWEVTLGLTQDANGTLDMTGGLIELEGSELFVGVAGVGNLNMSDPCGTGGGTINTNGGPFALPGTVDWHIIGNGMGTGRAQLDGGTIICGELFMKEGSTIDINEGVLQILGDARGVVVAYTESGWITGRNSSDPRNVLVEYDEVNDITTLTYDPTPDLTLAWKPRPLPGSTDVTRTPTLSWSPGIYADTHTVYFGSSISDVNESATPVSVNQPGTTYVPGGHLKFGTTYYWRIDEVNDACEPYLWPGTVWNFTVGESVVVENFDTYASGSELRDVWSDWKVNNSGLEIDIEDDANYTRDGNSLMFIYNNMNTYQGQPTGSWTDAAIADLEGGSDWTVGDVKALALYFYGQAGNSAVANDQLNVVLEDTSSNIGVAKCPNTNALQEEWWHEWNIDLSIFDACGVNLDNLSRIHICSGDKYNPGLGGTGTLYFDEIRIFPTRCVAEHAPTGDVTDDCLVNYVDVNALATDWLEDDYYIVATSPASGPVGWWKLDEGDGTTAYDSAGSNDGIHGGPFTIEYANDPCLGYVLNFDGGGYVDIPSAAFADVNDELTITLWQYGTMTPAEVAHVMFQAHDGCDPYDLTVKGEIWYPSATGCDIYFDAGYGGEGGVDSVNSRVGPDGYQGQWNHYAFTKNSSTAEMRIYLNGVLLADEGEEQPSSPVRGSEVSLFKLGSDADGERRYGGYMSDVRLYNYALSYGEVRYVAGEMDDLFIPLPRPEIDLYLDGAINFLDYALLADDWLVELLWP